MESIPKITVTYAHIIQNNYLFCCCGLPIGDENSEATY
uniref:Uncharacterized protein n=1 Tax=Rhizophora mucronata TaxID=61149 RepID=A0A2P2MH19_RHIMU